MIYGLEKPVVVLKKHFDKRIHKKLSDLFVKDTSDTLILLESVNNVIEKFINRQNTHIFDRNKTYCCFNVATTTIDYLKNEVNLKLTNFKECDYFISSFKVSSHISYKSNDFSYIETDDTIYDISNADWYCDVSPKKLYELLNKSKLLPKNATYKRISSSKMSIFSGIKPEVGIAILERDVPIIDLSYIFKAFSDEHEILTMENIEAIEELFKSPDSEAVKLGYMLLSTSNYSKLYYTTRAILFRNSPQIRGKLGHPEYITPGFIEAIGSNVICFWEDRPFKLTDINIILDADEEITLEDKKMLEAYIGKEMDESLDKVISKKTKNSFNKLGYKLEITLIKN